MTSTLPTSPAPLTLTVPDTARPQRLDAYLGGALRDEGISREKIKQAIAAGNVLRNNAPCLKPNTAVQPGDILSVTASLAAMPLAPETGDLAILYRDKHLAVLHKPAGLTVHPAPGRTEGTLAHRLLHHFPELAAIGGLRPGIVHRLDKDTSGLILIALTEKSRLALAASFAERLVHKEYLALVHGAPSPACAELTEPIGRHEKNKTKMAVVPVSRGGKEAHSTCHILRTDPGGAWSLVRIAIHTGRTHQIRVHMAHAGHALIGDATYAAPNNMPGGVPNATASRQMLHAWRLSFPHPATGEAMRFCCPPPEDFTETVRTLVQRMQRVVVTGSPGGGKSAFSTLLRHAAIPVWSADEAVKRLYARNGDGWHLLRARYGARFAPDGADVDKKTLGAAMQASEAMRREIENLVHPLVRHDLACFWQEKEKEGHSVAAAEVPLFLESGWRDPIRRAQLAEPNAPGEILVGVYAPFEQRAKRMRERRGWTDAAIAAVESWQLPEEQKIRAADLVVDNTGSISDLQCRAEQVVRILERLRASGAEAAVRRTQNLWSCTR